MHRTSFWILHDGWHLMASVPIVQLRKCSLTHCGLIYGHGDTELNQLQAFSAWLRPHTECHPEIIAGYDQQAATAFPGS